MEFKKMSFLGNLFIYGLTEPAVVNLRSYQATRRQLQLTIYYPVHTNQVELNQDKVNFQFVDYALQSFREDKFQNTLLPHLVVKCARNAQKNQTTSKHVYFVGVNRVYDRGLELHS